MRLLSEQRAHNVQANTINIRPVAVSMLDKIRALRIVMDQTGCKSRKMVIYYTLGPLVAIKVHSWPWT